MMGTNEEYLFGHRMSELTNVIFNFIRSVFSGRVCRILGAELAGITIAVALIAGYVTGKILSIFGRRIEPYIDSEEFVLE